MRAQLISYDGISPLSRFPLFTGSPRSAGGHVESALTDSVCRGRRAVAFSLCYGTPLPGDASVDTSRRKTLNFDLRWRKMLSD